MFGKSVYLTGFDKETFTDSSLIDVYFTSLHIAEEFSETYRQQAEELLATLAKTGKRVITDLSPRGVAQLGYESLEEFAQANPFCVVRCDFGFSQEELFAAAHYAAIGINASTLDFKRAGELKAAGAEVWAIHNFYPRPETGLDEQFFTERNRILKSMGVRIGAFLAGDQMRRGPVYEGLPTLEAHRSLPPYVQYIELTKIYGMDLVLLGDPSLSVQQENFIVQTEKDQFLRLPITLETCYNNLYERIWTVREDSPCWTARLLESRAYATAGERIVPKHCVERTVGVLTIDNERYARYSGEIQIVRAPLSADKRVNVIGKVEERYLPLLKSLRGNQKIQFIQKEKNDV